MMDIDLNNLTLEIRKSTPKYYRRAKIWVKNGKARIILTDQEKWFEILDMCCMMNHEFLHWILCCTAGHKWGLKKYDKFLESLDLYFHESMLETWL